MSDDIFIGFTQTPEGLEEFLKRELYVKSSSQVSPDSTLYVASPQLIEQGVDVWYSPKAFMTAGKEEVPNWRVLRFKRISIVSELDINFSFRDWKDREEARRLADKVMETFNAIECDPNFIHEHSLVGEYFASDGTVVWP